MSQQNTVELKLIKKELWAVLSSIEYRLKHLQDCEFSSDQSVRSNVAYDEEILEPLFDALKDQYEDNYDSYDSPKY